MSYRALCILYYHRLQYTYCDCTRWVAKIGKTINPHNTDYTLTIKRLYGLMIFIFSYFAFAVLQALPRRSVTHAHTQEKGRRGEPGDEAISVLCLFVFFYYFRYTSQVFKPHLRRLSLLVRADSCRAVCFLGYRRYSAVPTLFRVCH